MNAQQKLQKEISEKLNERKLARKWLDEAIEDGNQAAARLLRQKIHNLGMEISIMADELD